MPKNKPSKPGKTAQQRHNEVVEIKHKFADLGLSTEMDCISQVFAMLNDFAETGASCSAKVKLAGLKRVACLRLAIRPGAVSTVDLQYDEHV